MIFRYESTAAVARAYVAAGCHYGGERDSWFNGETESTTLRLAETGNTALVPQAEALLSQLDTQIETARPMWQRAPAGAFCSVPDVLAGLPTPMRRRIEVADDRAPITILVCSSCSAGIDAKTMQKRGTVILALVMALSRLRPVSLQSLATTHGRDTEGETIITNVINTAPLDLASACYCLTSVGFARRLTYGLAKKLNGFNGSWPRKFRYHQPELYYDRIKPMLVNDPAKCLIIGAAQLGDELLATPLVWIDKQIKRFTQEEGES